MRHLPRHPYPTLRSAGLTLLLTLSLLAPSIHSQTPPPSPPQSPPAAGASLTIRMLNGKSGKPMRRYELRAQFQGSPLQLTLTTDKQGIAHLDLPPTATAVSLIAITRKDHPDQPAYNVCGPFGQYLPIPDLLAHGFVPQNACSDNLHLTAQPAEVFYLIEPLPWYHPATE